MNMVKIKYLVNIVITLVLLSGCVSQEEKEAINYRSKIQNHHRGFLKKVQEFTNKIDNNTTDEESIRLTKELLSDLDIKLKEIEKIEPYKGDSDLKDALLNLCEVYYTSFEDMLVVGEKYKGVNTRAKQQAISECQTRGGNEIDKYRKQYENELNEFNKKYVGNSSSKEKSGSFSIVGDWELVKTEYTSSSNTAADQYSRMMSDGMNSFTENIKMIYSFSATGKCFIYGYPKGLTDEFSIAIFKAKGKYGNYKIRGNWLTINLENALHKLKIIDANEDSFTAKEDDMVLKFVISSGDIDTHQIQQDNQ